MSWTFAALKSLAAICRRSIASSKAAAHGRRVQSNPRILARMLAVADR